MKLKFIYGVIGASRELSLGSIGVGREEVVSFSEGGLALVISPWRARSIKGLPLRENLLALMEYQRVLEAVMELCFVLPVRFGTILPQASLTPLLQQGSQAFAPAIDHFQGKVQYEFHGYCKLPFLLREKEREGGEIRGFLEARRQRVKEAVLSRLGPLDWVENPADDSLALSLNLLVPKGADLRKVLEEMEGELHLGFRLLGPMPPYSFCTVHIKEVSPSSFRFSFRREGG